jgi:hypothetical protein
MPVLHLPGQRVTEGVITKFLPIPVPDFSGNENHLFSIYGVPLK